MRAVSSMRSPALARKCRMNWPPSVPGKKFAPSHGIKPNNEIMQTRKTGTTMKTYEGERTLRGAKVTVDGVPLSPRTELHCFNKTGFEWTYAGPGPHQLALALLADH